MKQLTRANVWSAGQAAAGAVLCAFMLAATALAGQRPAAVERPTLAALLARAGHTLPALSVVLRAS